METVHRGGGMKPIYLLAVLAVVGCNRHEDRPAQNVPHVAGQWVGTGTDDAIGFFNIEMTLTQSNTSAVGTYTMVGAVATIHGDARLDISPYGGTNLRITLVRTNWTVNDPANSNRVCNASLVSSPASITNGATSFHYTMSDCQGGTWIGGATLTKSAGTN